MTENSKKTGLHGEEIAVRHLTDKGYSILERNYRGDRCEIDIIAKIQANIVFCEVKTARSGTFGPSISHVSSHKIIHIVRAAEEYISTHETDECSFRFDVIGIEMNTGMPVVTHIENAFTAPETV
jgi:putative endonuclease